MIKTTVNIAGVEFKNPVTVASGTFGNGYEMSEYLDLNRLGGICMKGVSTVPWSGNKPPRIAEVACGTLNSVGLQNSGVDAYIKYVLPRVEQYDTNIIANVCGNSIEEYVQVSERLGDLVDMLELNVSCPNVQHGCAIGVNPKLIEELTTKVKMVAKVPVMVKLSPNVTDITETARAAESGGADAVSLINTILGMKIDIKTRRPIMKNNVGGLSGPAVKPVAVRMVWQVANSVKIPIIGMGGIMTGEDAIEFMLAGATAVSVGTANLVDPMAAIRIIDGIESYMMENNIGDINDITGKLLLN